MERSTSNGLWVRVLLLALLVLASAGETTGCATAHGHARFAGGVEVYTFRHGYANAQLVAQGGNYFLVDGGYERFAPRLDADLRDAGFDPAHLRAIVVTHGHADHAGGARYFQQRYNTPIVAGAGDRAMLASGHNERLCPTSSSARGRLAEDQAGSYASTTPDVAIESVTPLEPLTGIAGRIVPLPGHTAGSLVVLVGDVALVGDLFRGSILGSSAEVHFYMCDVPANRRDIHRLLTELAPTAQTFFVGHFGPVARADVLARFDTPP